MRAVYLIQQGVFEKKELSIPKLRQNEVLVKVKSVGICGSDVHYWAHGKIGDFIVDKPLILGHEVAGEIVEVGEKVQGLFTGDRVVIEPGTPCGDCVYCKTGRYNLCPEIIFYATPPNHGAFQEFVAHDSSLVFKIPDGISNEVATLVEPLAVGVFAFKRAKASLGEKVIIFGSGVIGLCTLLAAKSAGIKHVAVVDVRQDRLDLAKELGADRIFNVNESETNIAENYYDVAFECAGVSNALIDASKSVKAGGRIVLIGLGASSTQQAPIVNVTVKEQMLIGIFRYANVFPIALDILEANTKSLEKLITHRYEFDNLEDGFRTAKEDPAAVKVMVNFEN